MTAKEKADRYDALMVAIRYEKGLLEKFEEDYRKDAENAWNKGNAPNYSLCVGKADAFEYAKTILERWLIG